VLVTSASTVWGLQMAPPAGAGHTWWPEEMAGNSQGLAQVLLPSRTHHPHALGTFRGVSVSLLPRDTPPMDKYHYG
jgi:hypothetical protein